ncbi:hypothetical protein [Eikenella sp. NML01-A-086]|uniref:hypothetical protein n=1 Tax=Eikenella sp. NML01-A-086 TaxID=1795826 RepID=UPI0007E27A98|nr:hypothetical protein [Eikenella sp. NML01-A-086]OAM27801.1 hypothetical protein A7P94_05230 [Eikenella sp. NML01-A-086]
MTTLTAAAERLTSSMLDSKRMFKDEDYPRLLRTALAALNAVRPLHKVEVLKLVAWQTLYPCPEDLNSVFACWWGRSYKAHTAIWADNYPGRLPEWRVLPGAQGRLLQAQPAPSARQIQILGNRCELEYCADHVLTDTACTLDAELLDLLHLRAQAEAMRDLAMRNATTSYQLREGIGSVPRNGTPAYLYQELLAEFERRVL